MQSLADFKKACKPGAKFWFTSGWYTGMRTVTIAQAHAVAFTHPRKPEESSWLYYPRRSEVEFIRGGMLVIDSPMFYIPVIEEPTKMFKSLVQSIVQERIQQIEDERSRDYEDYQARMNPGRYIVPESRLLRRV